MRPACSWGRPGALLGSARRWPGVGATFAHQPSCELSTGLSTGSVHRLWVTGDKSTEEADQVDKLVHRHQCTHSGRLHPSSPQFAHALAPRQDFSLERECGSGLGGESIAEHRPGEMISPLLHRSSPHPVDNGREFPRRLWITWPERPPGGPGTVRQLRFSTGRMTRKSECRNRVDVDSYSPLSPPFLRFPHFSHFSSETDIVPNGRAPGRCPGTAPR